jgi:putative transposase
MSRKYKFHDKDAVYFVSFSVVNWIDVFTRNEYRQILVDSIKHCMEHKGLAVHAWVIMSNHVHLLISLKDNSNNALSNVMRDLKKFTATHLIKAIRENERESRKDWMMQMFGQAGAYNSNNTNFQFWRQDNHPIQMKNSAQCHHTIDYIHENPVKAGWVNYATNFPWSSAADYNGGTGPITIEMLDISYVRTV